MARVERREALSTRGAKRSRARGRGSEHGAILGYAPVNCTSGLTGGAERSSRLRHETNVEGVKDQPDGLCLKLAVRFLPRWISCGVVLAQPQALACGEGSRSTVTPSWWNGALPAGCWAFSTTGQCWPAPTRYRISLKLRLMRALGSRGSRARWARCSEARGASLPPTSRRITVVPSS